MATEKNNINVLIKGDNEEANQGWADAMARILQKELPENKVSEFNKLTWLRLHVIIIKSIFWKDLHHQGVCSSIIILKKGKYRITVSCFFDIVLLVTKGYSKPLCATFAKVSFFLTR